MGAVPHRRAGGWGNVRKTGHLRPAFLSSRVGNPQRVGYTDFYWKESRVVGEFDGEEKYLKPEFRGGRSASQVVVEEKKRENRIRAMGINVVRWDWAELAAPGTLERKLAAAGVARRRTRSAVLDAQNRL